MPRIVEKAKNPEFQPETAIGYLGGLNTFQDETLIKDSELTEAKNILLSVDGIEPRPGTTRVGTDDGDSRTYGTHAFYKSDGTRFFLRMQGGTLKQGITSPSTIGGTFTSSTRANFVTTRDLVFIFNGVDALATTNGSSVSTYSALSTPAGLAVSPQGTTGSTPYSYRVSAFRQTADQVGGETLACASVAITNGNATLNATNFNRLTWSAVTGATGYIIWGRKATGLGETKLDTVYGVTTYDDNGTIEDPSSTEIPPEANNTAGIICSMGCFALGRIFAAGDPSNPSRLYYGGVGTNVGNFSQSPEGGGYYDVFRADGAQIRAIAPFQGGVIIWKDNAIYKFSFDLTTGFAKIEEITRSFGGIAIRGWRHVENDIIFLARKDGRIAFYSLGNQENYAGSVLRTNELSIKIASRLEDVNLANIQHAACHYFNNLFLCAIPTTSSSVNDRIWCLDTRFGAWVYWEGDFSINSFSDYVASDGTQTLYAGDDATGKVIKLFESSRNDSGTAISVQWATKSFNQKKFDKYKLYVRPTFQFKDVTASGAVSGEIILDGAISTAAFTVNQQTTGGSGWGAFLWGEELFGVSPNGTTATGLSSDQVVQVRTRNKARSIKYQFRSNTLNARFKFLGVTHQVALLSDKSLPESSLSYTS